MASETPSPDYDRRGADVPHQSYDDRRGRSDRRVGPRRKADRDAQFRSALAMLLALCGGLVVLYVFLAAIGAFDVGDAVIATIMVVALAAVWASAFWYRLRAGALRAQRPDRERRGF